MLSEAAEGANQSLSQCTSWASLVETSNSVMVMAENESIVSEGETAQRDEQDDTGSIGSDESQWLIIDGGHDEGEPFEDAISIVPRSVAPPSPVPETHAKTSARLLSAALQITCGHCVSLEPGTTGVDVSPQWGGALEDFPSMSGAFLLGRVAVFTDAIGVGVSPSILARVVVLNDGAETWPDGATLRLVAGAGHGFGELPVGQLPAGHGAELLLDLHLDDIVAMKAAYGAGTGLRSAWTFEDGFGNPFGPLLVVEVCWI